MLALNGRPAWSDEVRDGRVRGRIIRIVGRVRGVVLRVAIYQVVGNAGLWRRSRSISVRR
jgi:hypothetical protein